MAAARGDGPRKLGHADLSDQNSDHDVRVLATAMVAARTGDRGLRKRAAAGVMDAIGTEKGGRTLALARGLHRLRRGRRPHRPAPLRPRQGPDVPQMAEQVRREKLSPSQNPTLIAHARAAPQQLGHARGREPHRRRRLPRRPARSGPGRRSVQGLARRPRASTTASPSATRAGRRTPRRPSASIPPGSTKDGVSIDGALPDDMRRGCDFKDPPCPTRYPWEACRARWSRRSSCRAGLRRLELGRPGAQARRRVPVRDRQAHRATRTSTRRRATPGCRGC